MEAQFVQQHFERFYSGDTGYFPFGDTVVIPAYYEGVTSGTIDGVKEARYEETVYRIRVQLPEGHCDAFDENGEPQHVKTVLMHQTELSRLNPNA